VSVLVCTLGDLLLDVVVRLDGPIAEDADTYGRVHVGAGGQAANVAAWVAELNGRGRFVGKRADDPTGRLVSGELRRRGVEILGPEQLTGTGAVVSIATPDGRRTMLSDRGVAPKLREDELEPAWFEDCDWLHVAGYSLAGHPIREAAFAAAAHARKTGARVSLDVSSTSAGRQIGVEDFRAACAALGAELAFATEEERELVGDLPVETWVVKRGARGCVVESGSERIEHPAVPAEVVDATGAGDAFAAGYLLGGAELGLTAAARCIATMGAMP
jgi:sugar/nucleoside kinase (ribokinase family)